jgi:shikimate kinase
MKTNIALIGFMGTGKTTVGELLAERTGRQFIETDAVIEERAGKTITAIFRQDGEAHFRRLEHEVIRDAARQQNTVIACGGGAVLNPQNIELLRKSALVIYLAAAPSRIMRRLATGGNKRPLLDVPDRAAKVISLLDQRRPLYEKSADFKIVTTHLSIESIVSTILREIRRREGQDS